LDYILFKKPPKPLISIRGHSVEIGSYKNYLTPKPMVSIRGRVGAGLNFLIISCLRGNDKNL
jgi:hypothetical protein